MYIQNFLDVVLAECSAHSLKFPSLHLLYTDYFSTYHNLAPPKALKLTLLERSLKQCNFEKELWRRYFEEMESQDLIESPEHLDTLIQGAFQQQKWWQLFEE